MFHICENNDEIVKDISQMKIIALYGTSGIKVYCKKCDSSRKLHENKTIIFADNKDKCYWKMHWYSSTPVDIKIYPFFSLRISLS